ncbi:MAG: BMP family ABC transporter substrate-binding protein [Deltaproteobacteria bacterium]|jgi:basic membrane protein A|nr:BMP family ABC transporter substrate-binding protein [Deltaproteobacteria bacterium]MBW2537837.1 BMP family ABC transporter substrate-binding protein [Deltaproteobacteria bacterium]
MSYRRLVLITAIIAVLSILLPGRRDSEAGPTGPHAQVRVGLVMDVGGRGDKSFNDAAFEGLERAKRELGVTVELIEPAGAEDREAALRLFAARGFDLIFGVGFIFSTDINVAARDFPTARFACVDYSPPRDGSAPPPNVLGLGFREEQGSFLVGAVAGLMTESRHVGFVGGMDIPLIHRFEAGFRAGALHVCGDCRVHVGYAGTTPDAFRDPAKGKAVAISQISAGADIIYHAAGTTGHGVFEAARDMGALAIGVDADQHDEMPGTVVTSMVKRVDVAVFQTIRELTVGRFDGGLRSFGVAEGGVSYVSEGPHAAGIPQEVKKRVAELQAELARGAIEVPRK